MLHPQAIDEFHHRLWLWLGRLVRQGWLSDVISSTEIPEKQSVAIPARHPYNNARARLGSLIGWTIFRGKLDYSDIEKMKNRIKNWIISCARGIAQNMYLKLGAVVSSSSHLRFILFSSIYLQCIVAVSSYFHSSTLVLLSQQ